MSLAVSWIKSHSEKLEKDQDYIFAIRLKSNLQLIGCINIGLNEKHDRGYVGYWIGYDFWSNGFCT
jgi:[ribosomal protein S5]-alanine N-acetyltransferase